MSAWTPRSWQSRTAHQQPAYPDADALARVVGELAALPPLVTSWEVEALKSKLARCATGEVFLLQGGDCAESFASCAADAITAQLKILLQMSLVLVHGTKRKVVRVGRIAGQYAKPRSAEEERRGDLSLPSYRGDLVNRTPFTAEDRVPDPQLLLRGYERAALTLNFIRALVEGGFADLHHPEYWNLDFVRHSELRRDYQQIVDSIRDSVEFMENVLETRVNNMRRAEIYTSHEGLALHYEEAQTRRVPRRAGFYNLSTHFPWIGMRTSHPQGAHVEYFRGIRNPIAVKVGVGMDDAWLAELLEILHPENEPGRLTLIHRLGADAVEEHLPRLVEVVRRSGRTVTWCCDPMHGNTEITDSGRKTRRFDKILEETRKAFAVHEELGSVLGGVHLELTGEDVTECIGGSRGLDESDLERAYRSAVDPRLNYEQAMEMAMLVARHLRNGA
jgi:3-deoxy-7-phosphoheptulonate synthase